MNELEQQLAPLYQHALQECLSGAGEAALRRAYDLGRAAVGEGLGVLDMVAVYDQATQTMLQAAGMDASMIEKISIMHSFLMESLSPFEITHRSFRESNAALHRLNEMLEDETKRIAHLLHDNATQLLAAVHIALADMLQDPPSKLAERVQEIRGHLTEIESQLRRLSHELRPTILDDLGLMPALEFLATGIGKRSGLAIGVNGSTEGRLPTAVETALYRAVQEALINTAKHAQAKRALVHVSREPHMIHCAVRDNGVGFDPVEVQTRTGRGLGLTAIRERLSALGGSLQIHSSSQTGTELLITVPLGD